MLCMRHGSLCLYMCVCVQSVHECWFLYVCVRMHIPACVLCMPLYVCLRMSVCTCACVSLGMCSCKSVCVYVCPAFMFTIISTEFLV